MSYPFPPPLVCPAPPGDPTPFSDALSFPTGEALLPSVIAQTPRGAAWRTDEQNDGTHNSYQHRFWRAVCDPLSDLYAKLWKLTLSSTACTLSGPEDPLNDALEDWEAEFALPEPCVADVAQTVAQHKFFLRMKLTDEGGQSIGYFTCLAAAFGYTITINEFGVMRCGQGRCGQTKIGSPENEVFWQVVVPTPSLKYFRCGGSQCGRDPLGAYGRKRDLECLFNKWRPAHTQVKFKYVYIGAEKFNLASNSQLLALL